MLNSDQEALLEDREPDVRLCPHWVQVNEMGDADGPRAYFLVVKGHMVTDAEILAGDIPPAVDDHRLISVEIAMGREVWQDFVNTLVSQGCTPNRVTGAIRFLNAIPEMFRRNKRKDVGA